MNKTLYVKNEDLPLWNRAKEIAGGELGPTIVGLLKQYVEAHDRKLAEAAAGVAEHLA